MKTETAVVIGILMVGAALWYSASVEAELQRAARRSPLEQATGAAGGLIEGLAGFFGA